MTKSGFICKEGSSNYYVNYNDGMGGFLNPPHDAEHSFSIREERGGHDIGHYSLRSAIEQKAFPSQVKARAKYIIKSCWKSVSPDPLWVAGVYNYFHNCYAPENYDRNVSNCIIDNTNSLPAERHLAVLYIKEWFSDYPIRYEFIKDKAPFGGWSGGYYAKR